MVDWLGKIERGEDSDFSPMRKFQETQSMVETLLNPGEEITYSDASALQNMGILIVGNQNLRPDQLQLRGIDYQSIGALSYPGKSGVLDFLHTNRSGYVITDKEKDVVTQSTIGKGSDRHDAVYFAKVDDINKAGFSVFYAPVRTNSLHLRIVYKPYVNIDYPAYNIDPIPDTSLKNLADVFTKLTKK